MLVFSGNSIVQPIAGNRPVLLRKKIHGKMNPFQIAPEDGEVAPYGGTDGKHNRVVFFEFNLCRR